MLKIEKKEKNVFPFKELAPMELFYREDDRQDIYYSFIDCRGMPTAVNLTTGEEPDDLAGDELIIRIQGTLTILGQAVKACLFYLTRWAGRPRRGRPVIPSPHLIWQFSLLKVGPAYAPLLSRKAGLISQPCGPVLESGGRPYGARGSIKLKNLKKYVIIKKKTFLRGETQKIKAGILPTFLPRFFYVKIRL